MLLLGQVPIRHEPLRPQIHFTAPAGWLNDPNGLVYYAGEYHLFYQHNPEGTEWGNMTWGHAVSKDLLRWRDLPYAIEPDDLGTIFSGSAVVDSRNVSGLGAKGHPALLCFYTAAGGTNDASKGKPFTQCLAYSTDGRAFQKHPKNPLISNLVNGNRDPRVVWDAEHRKWILALYLDNGTYTLFGSADLISWTRLSDVKIPGTDECPDFFPIRLDGDRAKTKWVFTGANGRYMVGSFDGVRFSAETTAVATNFGNTGYAAQTYQSDPKGRVIQIAWLNNSNFPGATWNQQMGFPNELKLVSTADGPRLHIQPVSELASLYESEVAGHEGVYDVPSGVFELSASWQVPTEGEAMLNLKGTEVRINAAAHKIEALGKTMPFAAHGRLDLRAVVDVSSIELYVQDGTGWMPLFRIPSPSDHRGASIRSPQSWRGSVRVRSLKSVWQ